MTAVSGKRSISLTWKAPSGSTDVVGYEISRSTSLLGTYTVLGITTALSYVNGGLTPRVQYSYRVAAYDRAGNRGTSQAVTAKAS